VCHCQDLADHVSTFPEPISVHYRGVDVFEVPPNGQGITALMALQVLKGLDVSSEHNSAEYLHTLIEVRESNSECCFGDCMSCDFSLFSA